MRACSMPVVSSISLPASTSHRPMPFAPLQSAFAPNCACAPPAGSRCKPHCCHLCLHAPIVVASGGNAIDRQGTPRPPHGGRCTLLQTSPDASALTTAPQANPWHLPAPPTPRASPSPPGLSSHPLIGGKLWGRRRARRWLMQVRWGWGIRTAAALPRESRQTQLQVWCLHKVSAQRACTNNMLDLIHRRANG